MGSGDGCGHAEVREDEGGVLCVAVGVDLDGAEKCLHSLDRGGILDVVVSIKL